MDGRLAQVRALVDERWREAKERRRENELLARRVEALECHLATALLPVRARQSAAVATLEERILHDTNATSACRRELEMRRKELERIDAQAWRSTRDAEFLETAVQAQTMSEEEVWEEMLEDFGILQEQNESRQAHDEQRQREAEASVKRLEGELVRLDGAIASCKAETGKIQHTMDASKRRKRALERELEELSRKNARLKRDAANQRRDSTPSGAVKPPAVVEDEELDSILRELDGTRR